MDKEKIENIIKDYNRRTNKLNWFSNVNLAVIFVIIGVTIAFLYVTSEAIIENGEDDLSYVLSPVLIIIMMAYLVHIMYKTYRYNFLLADYYRTLTIVLTLYLNTDVPFSTLLELLKYSKLDIGSNIGIGELTSSIVNKK